MTRPGLSIRTWVRSAVVAAALALAPAVAPAAAQAAPPVVVLTSSAHPFSGYVAEIMRAEGLNGFAVAGVGADLSGYDVAVLGDVPVSAAQANALASWVAAGGNLIALSPDPKLAPLLGIAPAGGAPLANAYLRAPSAGIVGTTIQYHGPADRYRLNGAGAVATLYSNAATPTPYPAVTLRSYGAGQAAAFTFDLARSVSLTRQGNPASVGRDLDGLNPIRPNDLFYGGWVDLSRIHIPQADELQRLFANLVTGMSDRPVPRFWYLPRDEPAAVVMTGDDHADGGTAGRFNRYKQLSPPRCSVARWECVRSTSYIYVPSPLTNAQVRSFQAEGFEVALHPTRGGCGNPTLDQFNAAYGGQLAEFRNVYPAAARPVTSRFHCVSWPDWSTHAKVEVAHGIRLDTNYYHFPPGWARYPGFMTGSGLLMRFADLNGATINVYQAHTHINDELAARDDPSVTAAAIRSLLSSATGPQGFYGIFTANMHTDDVDSPGSEAIVAAAKARGVPVISARQALQWVEGRSASSFANFSWNDAGLLGFTVAVAPGATGLRGMLPIGSPRGPLKSLARDGRPVALTARTIKGVPYAFFDAAPGTYRAQYGDPTSTPPPTSRPGGADRTAPTLTLRFRPRLTLRTLLRRGLRYRLRCSEPCRLRARLVVKVGKRSRVAARASRRLRAERTARLTMRIKSKTARRMVRSRRARLTLRLVASDAAGNHRTLVRRVTIVRPR